MCRVQSPDGPRVSAALCTRPDAGVALSCPAADRGNLNTDHSTLPPPPAPHYKDGVHRRWIIFMAAILVVDAIVGWLWWRHWREHRYDSEIVAAARRYNIEPALVKAVVWRESAFDARARGRAGELGLMQLMPASAGEWAAAERVPGFMHKHVLDPRTNTFVGAWYLAHALKRYPATDNPTAYALADYNAGRGNVLKWLQGPAATNSSSFLSQMTFPGTRRYIESVLSERERFRREMAQER